MYDGEVTTLDALQAQARQALATPGHGLASSMTQAGLVPGSEATGEWQNWLTWVTWTTWETYIAPE